MNPYVFPGLKGAKIPVQFFLTNTTPENVIQATCEVLKIPHNQLVGKTRKREVVEARHIISFILVKKAGMTLEKVGMNYLGGRDHSTVINSLRQFNALFDTEEQFQNKFYSVLNNISI